MKSKVNGNEFKTFSIFNWCREERRKKFVDEFLRTPGGDETCSYMFAFNFEKFSAFGTARDHNMGINKFQFVFDQGIFYASLFCLKYLKIN